MRSAETPPFVNGVEPGMTMNAGKERIQNALSIEPTGKRQRCERVVAVQPVPIKALVDERETRDIRRREQEIPVMADAHRRESADPAEKVAAE